MATQTPPIYEDDDHNQALLKEDPLAWIRWFLSANPKHRRTYINMVHYLRDENPDYSAPWLDYAEYLAGTSYDPYAE